MNGNCFHKKMYTYHIPLNRCKIIDRVQIKSEKKRANEKKIIIREA